MSAHLLACIWLKIGISDEEEGWPYVNRGLRENEIFHIYVFSYYWIIETVTTVGYGDYTGSTLGELIFSMGLMVTPVSHNF